MKKIKYSFGLILLLFCRVAYTQYIEAKLTLNEEYIDGRKECFLQVQIINNIDSIIKIHSNLNSFYNYIIYDENSKELGSDWWFNEKMYDAQYLNSGICLNPEAFLYRKKGWLPYRIVNLNPIKDVLVISYSDYKKLKKLSEQNKICENRMLFVLMDDFSYPFSLLPYQKIVLKQNINNLIDNENEYSIQYLIESEIDLKLDDAIQKVEVHGDGIDGVIYKSPLGYNGFKGVIRSNTIVINKKEK